MSDYIQTLPTDEIPLSREEEFFLQPVLKNENSLNTLTGLIGDLKDPLVFGVFFMILNLPTVEDFIRNTVSYARKSQTSFLLTKTGLFVTMGALYMNRRYIMK